MIATLTTAARRAAAAIVSAVLLAGPPYALLRFTASPLPDRPPTWDTVLTTLTSPLTDDMIIAGLAALLWAAWVSFVWSVLAEAAAALTGRRLPQPRALTPARGLATLLVTMITGGVLATAGQAATATPAVQAYPAGTATAVPSVVAHQQEAGTAADRTRTAPVAVAVAHPLANTTVTLVADGRQYRHTVARGDTLSKIAEQWLGDADRWPEIFALNRGTHFPKVGGTLRDPNMIHPGWTLDLPADATPPAGQRPHRTTPPPSTRPPAPAPTPADLPPPAPTTTTDPAPATSSPASRQKPEANPAATHDSRPARTGHGVSLPSGSWVDAGLAAAIIAAVAMIWAHRQRRYRPRTPLQPHPTDDPAAAPMPAVVRRIRRGLRPDAAAIHPLHSDADTREGQGGGNEPPPRREHDVSALPRTSPASGAVEAATHDAAPVAPALAHPLSAVWPPAGLGLTGPGADAAARGFLTAALATSGEEHPDARPHVVIPASTAATLLGAAAVNLPRTPRLTVTADFDDALATLEQQTLRRSRLVYEHEVDTVAALRAADPHEQPLAPIMLLADATGRHERARVAALLAQGQRLDIHGVLLGVWPDGDTASVAADGTVTRAASDARHGPHPADIGRLAVLDPTETVDLLATLAESHTGQPPVPAPVEPAPPPQPDSPGDPPSFPEPKRIDKSQTSGSEPGSADDDRDSQAQPAASARIPPPLPPETDDTSLSVAGSAGSSPAALSDSPLRSPRQTTEGTAADDSRAAGPRPDRVEVTVLGPPAIVNASHPRTLRAKSLELLVYLAANDGDASIEAILEDLLPEAPSSKALHRLHTYVSDLRAVLRHHTGPGSYLTNPHRRYRLNPDRFDIDLWRLRAALRTTGGTHPDRLQALRHAVDNYRPLAEGCDYEWLDAYRHAAQRQALDAATALIEAHEGNPAEQATICATALPHHPYNEQLYQQAMRAHAALGDPDAIRALRSTLTHRLSEIDAEPSDDTLDLVHCLIDGIQPGHRRRPSDGRPA
ncbi:BTAD domain-containing putative transcriptional regulator [Micromonospora sp. HUAS LYJ1]|uniref:BTAD domain-containing putative transcriptional regulator n=1 Tax=Micromonospora sp. HUAS LYJ1 TaxID=3061626 RepID=UPI002672A9C9|nr:BTAD domain-containing putative transcriptional regulator [Micromonospora sp. HUAS LYJ1]WKU03405.1 BTAD domain-containing putative transcriptional regulator [Micromonospora sp. HUAS LYJ1]